jgi:hypothetical protein
MDAVKHSGRPLVGLVIALLLTGCATGASPTQAPASATPSATPTAPIATPTPTPSAAGAAAATDRTYVSGTMGCKIVGGDVPETPGDYRPYPLSIDCAYSMSDPRVSGTAHYELAATFVGLDSVNGTSNFWSSSSTLETAGGTWTGSGFGSEFVSDLIKPNTLYSNGTDLYEGQGAFAGLTYRVLWARERNMAAGGLPPYVASGWIEPAK